LTQRRQRIRANRKPYNAIFFWEITDDNENGCGMLGGNDGDLQHCGLFGSNPAGVAAANLSLGGEADLDRFLRHAARRDPGVHHGFSEPVIVFHQDTLYILDRDVGFYCFTVEFQDRQTPRLMDFRHALEDRGSFTFAIEWFPSRQISGVPCGDALYFVSRTGWMTPSGIDSGAPDLKLRERHDPPKVIRYDIANRSWNVIKTPPCPHPASAQLFSLKGNLHLFLVQNKPSGRQVFYGWYRLSTTRTPTCSSSSADPSTSAASSSSSSSAASSSSSSYALIDEWIPQSWPLPALRNYFMHTIESNCVAVTLPSHVLKDGTSLCDKRKKGWHFPAASVVEETFGRQATTTEDDDDDADDEDDEEDAEVYHAFQQAMQNQPEDDENGDEDFDGGNSSSSSSSEEEEWEEDGEQDGDGGDDDDDDDDDEEDDDDQDDDDGSDEDGEE